MLPLVLLYLLSTVLSRARSTEATDQALVLPVDERGHALVELREDQWSGLSRPFVIRQLKALQDAEILQWVGNSAKDPGLLDGCEPDDPLR